MDEEVAKSRKFWTIAGSLGVVGAVGGMTAAAPAAAAAAAFDSLSPPSRREEPG